MKDQVHTNLIYKNRINKVVEYIDKNIRLNLSVEKLAYIANYSPYHFHRIFKAVMRETIHSYIKRIRVSQAAFHLLYSFDKSVSDIAFDCGFSSLSDFSRVFKSYYNVSPSKYKSNAELTKDIKDSLPKESEKKYIVSTFPYVNMAYTPCSGPNKELKNPLVFDAYNKLIKWANARDYITQNTMFLGLTMGIPGIIPVEKCRFKAGITVPHEINEYNDIYFETLDYQGKYVVCTFKWTASDFAKTFWAITSYIFKHWMDENGYIPDERPFIQVNRMDHIVSNLTKMDSLSLINDKNPILFDFYIPIKQA